MDSVASQLVAVGNNAFQQEETKVSAVLPSWSLLSIASLYFNLWKFSPRHSALWDNNIIHLIGLFQWFVEGQYVQYFPEILAELISDKKDTKRFWLVMQLIVKEILRGEARTSEFEAS